MSRSYRKNPVCKETNECRFSAKYGKHRANRAVRHHKNLPSYGAYKKAYCSWLICDFRFWLTRRKLQSWWENGELEPYLDVCLHRPRRYGRQEKARWKQADSEQ